MRIAVIDGGIEPVLCPNLLSEFDLYVQEDGRVIKRTESERILTDHGTVSARIICLYAPKAELCSLKVFDREKLQVSVSRLLAALAWCYQQKIPLIHMSLGSTLWMDYAPIRRIAARLVQNGQILVAAHSNNSIYTMPACFMGVLGVVTDKTYQKNEYHIVEAGWRQVQIQASSRHILVTEDGQPFETQVSNSYAAPVVTAKVHEILSDPEMDGKPVSAVYQKLAGQESNLFRMRPDFIEDAVLFHGKREGLWLELCFFSITERVDDPDSLVVAIDRNPYMPVVIIPSGSRETDGRVFRICQERCRLGFLYAGKAPVEFVNRDLLFWDEGQYCETFRHVGHKMEGVFPEDTARLLVEGEGCFSLQAAVKIQQEFQEHGYPCVIVSDYPYAYLYDMEYLPDDAEMERFAMDMAALRQASVMIYCLKNKVRNKEPKYDLKVSVEKRVEMETAGAQIYLPEMQTHGEIKRVYQYVLSYEEKDYSNDEGLTQSFQSNS